VKHAISIMNAGADAATARPHHLYVIFSIGVQKSAKLIKIVWFLQRRVNLNLN